jgi:diguanylate cyclase (GGDEF)-like protein
LEASLRQQADTDPLCALLNRRAAQERIAALLESNPKTCFAFYLLDIDNFKLVNDTFGHCAGDAVILGVADALRQTFRVSDLVGRLGGDEFAVFMPCAEDEVLLREKASSALRAIGRLSFPKYPDLKLSVSMGVALYPRDGNGFEALYQHADKALYQMKSSGKNGYALYGDEKSRA